MSHSPPARKIVRAGQIIHWHGKLTGAGWFPCQRRAGWVDSRHRGMTNILSDTVTNGGTSARQTRPLSPKAAELLNAIQLFLPLQFSVKTSRGKAIHPLRKRRRAETIAPS